MIGKGRAEDSFSNSWADSLSSAASEPYVILECSKQLSRQTRRVSRTHCHSDSLLPAKPPLSNIATLRLSRQLQRSSDVTE